MIMKKHKFTLIFALFVILSLVRLSAIPVNATFDEKNALETTNVQKNSANNAYIVGNYTTLMKISASTDIFNTTYAENYESSTIPEEYSEFIEALPDSVIDALPEDTFSGDADTLRSAASEVSGVAFLFTSLIEALGGAVTEILPTLTVLCGIVVLSAVSHTFASTVSPSLSGAVSFGARLCSFCSIAAVATASLSVLEEYFDRLLTAVASFLPLSGVLYAMGGNVSGAVSGTAALSTTLTVCEFFLNKTVIPIFCVCLSLTLLQAFDGIGALAGQSISGTVKKWYTTALAFVMMILTTAIAAQSVLASKADGAAMRGVKFATSSFIPVSGGALSSTLGALAASVELIRGAVGVIGVVVVLLMLIPVVVELALLRGVFALTSFMAGMLGCSGEQKLLTEIGSLYGYLEGIAALSAAVFVIAFGIFASTTAAV